MTCYCKYFHALLLQLSFVKIFDVGMCFLVSTSFGMIFTMDVVFGFVTLLLILPHVIICIPKLLQFYLAVGKPTKSRYFGQIECVQIVLICWFYMSSCEKGVVKWILNGVGAMDWMMFLWFMADVQY